MALAWIIDLARGDGLLQQRAHSAVNNVRLAKAPAWKMTIVSSSSSRDAKPGIALRFSVGVGLAGGCGGGMGEGGGGVGTGGG